MAEAAESITIRRLNDLERHQPAASMRRLHWITVPSGHTPSDVVEPGYLEGIATRFQPRDRIEVMDDDSSWFAELMVLDTSGGLRLAMMRFGELQGGGASNAMPRDRTGLQAIWKGAFLRWCAYRGDVLLKDKFASEVECRQWLASHAKAAAK